MNCDNCGHEVAIFDGEWYHVHREKDGDINFSKSCISLEDKEAEKFIEEEMAAVDKKVKEKFGENYGTWYWFAEVHCNCMNPQYKESE